MTPGEAIARRPRRQPSPGAPAPGEDAAPRPRSAPGGGATALLLALAAVAVSLAPAAGRLLEYDRARIAAGELWRLVTGHWAHWSAEHLLLDAAVFAILGSLVCRRQLAALLAAALPAVAAALWWLLPDMELYRGLSGLDAGLYVLVAANLLRRGRHGGRATTLLAAAALAGFAAKVGYEAATASALFVDSAAAGFVPVPLAHAAGGVAGAFVAMLMPPGSPSHPPDGD